MKNNRLGVFLIVSSLAAIAVLIGLSLSKQHETRMEQIRGQGIGVVRSLTTLPFDMLVPPGQATSVLESLFMFYKPADFVYAAVTTGDGKLLREVVRPGATTPAGPLSVDHGSPIGERTLQSAQTNRTIREFYGPVMTGGGAPAFVRVGYFEPRFAIGGQELSFFAMLALPTFLMVPFIYFILIREMKPLRKAYEKLEGALGKKGGDLVPPRAQFDVQRLASRIYAYVQDTDARMVHLEQEKVGLLTKNRLLEYGNNKLNFVLQSLPEGLLVLDPAGHVTFASAKVEAMLGVELGAVLSGPVDAWCKDEALKTLLLRYQTASVHALRAETMEFHPGCASETRMRIIAQPLVVANEGPAFGTLVVLQDITREHLGQCASQDFVAHVSHELKSPLNAISMYCEMLQSETAEDDNMRIQASNVIHDEVERMAALVNNLLSISKLEVGGFKPQCTRVKLDEFLQDVYNNQLPRAQANRIALELSVARDIPAAALDKDLFRIALNNLVSNALKYSESGGRVVVEAKEENDWLIISVQDNGIGVPAEEQAHVFKKFFRAQGGDGHKRSGHGLGLYLANEIVQLHHGRISLESAPGKGSKFSIYLKTSSHKELSLL